MALEIELWANNATTTLAAPISPSSTTCTVALGTGALFPNPSGGEFFRLTFNDAATGLLTEITTITNVTGDVLTFGARGTEGTAAQSWAANDLASNFPTADAMANLGQLTYLQTYGFLKATDSGAADAYVAALAPVPLALANLRDALISIEILHANTGGAATLNLNGLGAQPIKTRTGADPGAGLLAAGMPAILAWNGTNFIVLSA